MAAIDTASSNVSPIEAATRVHNLVYLAYVAVLVLAAFFTWLAWKTGNKVQDAIRADADARIAEASSKGTALENANLTLRGQVATLETNASTAATNMAGLQKDASDAKAAQQRVEIELSEQKERAAIADERTAKAQLELLQLQQELAKVADRHLSPKNSEALSISLKVIPPGRATIRVRCVPGTAESRIFAAELIQALIRGGWNVKDDTGVVGLTTGPPLKGLMIASNGEEPASWGIALEKALLAIGLPVQRIDGPNLSEGVMLIVGEK